MCLWVAWCEFSLYAWNETRLAPAFAIRDGINPYPPIDGGPLSTWIYGPIGIFINLPATLAQTPLAAVRIAGIINSIVVLLPLVVIFLGSAELRARGKVICGLALALSILLVPQPNLVLQVADHTAIACGLLSLWCLAREPKPSSGRLATIVALTVLAVWSKQIAVFLVAAHVGFLLLNGQRAAVWRYLAWFTLFNIVALVAFAWAFGFGNLWLNLVDIPARLGWANFSERLMMRRWSLVGQIGLPIAGLFSLWRARRWPSRERESGRFFQLGALAYSAMLPIGLFAFFKVGGDTNLLHSWDYLMPAALLWWLGSEQPSRFREASSLVMIAAFALALHVSDFVAPPSRPYTQHFDSAAALTTRYPQGIWFPQNPVITYYTDHKLWHSEDGVSTRFLAGYGIHEADFRRHLPPKLQAIAYPSVNTAPFSVPLLPELSVKTRVPYWVVYSLPSAAPL